MPAKNSAADDGYVHDKREQDAMRGQEGLGLGLPRRRREVVVRLILLVKSSRPTPRLVVWPNQPCNKLREHVTADLINQRDPPAPHTSACN